MGKWTDAKIGRFSMTDIGVGNGIQPRGQSRIAMRFVQENKHRLIYVMGIGWMVWCGSHWRLDDDNAPLRYCLKTVMKTMSDAASLPSKDERKELFQDANMCTSHNALEGVLNIAKSLKPIATSVTRLDNDPYLFNCRDGTIDLRTMECRKHDSRDLITKVAGCGYDPEAEGMVFHKFLSEVLPDGDVREFVQKLVGYSMLGTVKEHILPLFIGSGRNGKGKLMEVMLKTFGDYGHMMSPQLLVTRDIHGNGNSAEMAQLVGKRLVGCSETEENQRFASATLKSITGGDIIQGKRLYKDPFTFVPSHTIFLMTNREPLVDGSDFAIKERLRRIEFTRSFTGNNQDPSLGEKLEMELPVVLRWALEGYEKYHKSDLRPPRKVEEDTHQYMVRNDDLAGFLQSRCVVRAGVRVRSGELWQEWIKWNKEEGESLSDRAIGTQKSFSTKIISRLGQSGVSKKRDEKGIVFTGIGLLGDSRE